MSTVTTLREGWSFQVTSGFLRGASRDVPRSAMRVVAHTSVPLQPDWLDNGTGSARAARVDALWISSPGASPYDFGVYHFRRTFDLPQKPARFVVHVSADNRYQLFVNGTRVSWGPARGDLSAWPYETLDIAPWLQPGKNVAGRGGVELRGARAAGAAHLAGGLPAAGRLRGRSHRQHLQGVARHDEPRLPAAADHLRAWFEGTGPPVLASTWTAPRTRGAGNARTSTPRRGRRPSAATWRARARPAMRTAATCWSHARSR